jgi:CDP-glucose 4,6-dehydratase
MDKEKILITGHTGFVGSWLFYYFLYKKKTDAYGLSLKPKHKNDLFNIFNLHKKNSTILNILDKNKLLNYIKKIKPNIIVHLAAESLVLQSIKNPNKTYETNINGTLNILEMIRKFPFIKTAVFFTTDKVYENNETSKKFKESDKLNGDEPYSGSKAASEIILNSYTKTFLKKKNIIILRCGNIIGGLDNNKDRIIPDLIKSYLNKKKIILRNVNATRPWQHITDIIFIVDRIIEKFKNKKAIHKIYNISPVGKYLPVKYIVRKFANLFKIKKTVKLNNKIEKKNLYLNSEKIYKELKIKNVYSSRTSIKKVLNFYYNLYIKKVSVQKLIDDEILNYESDSKII